MNLAYRLFGNIDTAATLRGEARRLHYILDQNLNNLGLDSGSLARTYADGSRIRIFRNALGLDFAELFSGGGAVPALASKQAWIIFLFYQPTKYRYFTLGKDRTGVGAIVEITLNLPKTFPLPYTWYSSYVNADKDPTPAVISNQAQGYHYINTVVDPQSSLAGNGYDDWHYHSFYLNLMGWLDDNVRRESPGPFPWISMHFSISPWTAFPPAGVFWREGGILQPIRQYAAEKSLTPLQSGTVIVETEMANSLPGYYGRKGYTLDFTGRYATSWNERVNVSAIGSPTINSNQGNPWTGWFFWPWIPYLHEMSAFQSLNPAVDQTGAGSVTPAMANPVTYALNFINSKGAQITNGFLQENAILNYSGGAYSSSSTNSQGVLLHMTGGGPFGMPIITGSWWDWQGPNEHNTGPFSYTITNLAGQSNSGSASGTFFTPIGSVGNQGILKIQNDFTFSQLYTLANTDTYSKSTTFPWQYYLWWSGIEEYWLPDGAYTDNTSGTLSYSTSEGRTLNISQKLLFQNQVIENLISRLTYSYQNTQNGTGAFSFTFLNTSQLPISISGSYTADPGTAEITQNVSAIVTRNIVCVEVLDFDSHPNGNFIVIYKKITISHTQTNTATASVSSAPAGPTREAGVFPWPGIPTLAQSYQVTGTRKVEYYLFWQNSQGQNEKVKLAEFDSAVSGDANSLVHTASGQRLYGVTCQVGIATIVYHALLENYTGTPSAPTYDSPMNFEDYSYQGNVRQFSPANIIVGCVPDTNSSAARVQSLLAAEPNPIIYSAGIHVIAQTQEDQL